MRGHRGGHHSSMDETLAMLAISTEGDKAQLELAVGKRGQNVAAEKGETLTA